MAGNFEEGPISNKGSEYIVHDVEDPPLARPVSPSGSIIPDDGHIVTQQERLNLIRGLSQRHIQMIAIAGAIVREIRTS